MLHDSVAPKQKGVKNFSFSNIVWRCLERSRRQPAQLFQPSWDELAGPLTKARKSLCLADDDAIRAVIAANPDCVRLVRPASRKEGKTQHQPGIVALLPLSSQGVNALLAGKFDGACPDPSFICGPNATPAAVYIWLIAMPGTMGRMLTAFAEALDSFLTEPVPIFSRAMHAHADKLHRHVGFLSAHQVYPNAPRDLLVILPEQKAAAPSPVVEVSVARTIEDIFKVFSVRSATYLAEQFCLYEEEFDGNDFCATHWLGTVDGDAAGCIRARFFGDFAKLERLAIRAEYRTSRLAFKLVRTAINHCRHKGYNTLFGHSRLDLQPFWKVFGFRLVEGRPRLEFANIQYVEMRLDLPQCDGRITIDEAPLRLLRPEGSWDVPGPFEQPPKPGHEKRIEMLNARTRTIGNAKISA